MSRPPGSVDDVRVVLYTREGCHLCEEARTVVEAVCTAAGEAWREVDIEVGVPVDAAASGAPAGGAEDRAGQVARQVDDPRGSLVARYGDYVPVVEVDGVQQGFWRVDAARLARRLAG